MTTSNSTEPQLFPYCKPQQITTFGPVKNTSSKTQTFLELYCYSFFITHQRYRYKPAVMEAAIVQWVINTVLSSLHMYSSFSVCRHQSPKKKKKQSSLSYSCVTFSVFSLFSAQLLTFSTIKHKFNTITKVI